MDESIFFYSSFGDNVKALACTCIANENNDLLSNGV